MYGLHCSKDRWGGGPKGHIVSIKRAADEKRQRIRKIFDEEREKYSAKNGFLRNTSTDSKETTFVILINHASAPIRKERLSPTSKAAREASRNEFVENGGVPDRVKSFREIDSRHDRRRAQPEFVKPIRDALSKEQNLIWSRPSRGETGLEGREMDLDSRKNSRRDGMMRSKSFETQEEKDKPDC